MDLGGGGTRCKCSGWGLDLLQMQWIWGDSLQMKQVGFGPAADVADFFGDCCKFSRVGFGPAADAADLGGTDANAVGWVWLRV